MGVLLKVLLIVISLFLLSSCNLYKSDGRKYIEEHAHDNDLNITDYPHLKFCLKSSEALEPSEHSYEILLSQALQKGVFLSCLSHLILNAEQESLFQEDFHRLYQHLKENAHENP